MTDAPKEAVVATNIIKFINRQEDSHAHKVHGGPYSGAVGEPDIDACIRGRCVKIEVKRPGKEKTLTPNQARSLARWSAAGALAFVATSVEEVRERLIDEGLIHGVENRQGQGGR